MARNAGRPSSLESVSPRGERRPKPKRSVGRYTLLSLTAVTLLLPVWVTVSGAIQPYSEVLDYPASLIPWPLTTEPIREAWRIANLDRYLINSAVVTVLIMIGQVVTSVLAAYAFTFLKFPYRRALFALFIGTLMVPTEVTIVANFQTIRSLGWLDSYPGLVAPFLAAAFGTFLLRQAFMSLPREMEEAARMDGMGHLRFMWEVVVPLARPAIGAVSVFSFLTAWNQYLWPLIVTTDPDMRTVQIGLRSLASANLDELNLVMAGTMIAALPIIVILLLFQKQLVRGLTAGAVKG
ncbi:MAG: carbohydrate ABC transporter permease [Actinomycetia bacterium]|nr:carbohydrate ABC transporter permease [Actinomycetes bacterium]MCP4963140.1 carbohydrate ABC transporter permease [Actinomycetes bacterium]